MPRKNARSAKCRRYRLVALLLLCACTQEVVTFIGFPPLRSSAPEPMSPSLVTEVMESLAARLDTHALQILNTEYTECAQYTAELHWLAPTSPYARRQLVDILNARDISPVRFTKYVQESPDVLRPGTERLLEQLDNRRAALLQAAPSGCTTVPHWLERPPSP